MKISKHMWQHAYEGMDQLPAWRCPNCQLADVKYEAGTLRKYEPNFTQDLLPEESGERFDARLKCQNSKCGDSLIIAGTTRLGQHEQGEFGGQYPVLYSPAVIYPAPLLFELSSQIPYAVRVQVERASNHWWNDKAASLNCLRAAIEASLTEFKIPTTSISKKVRRHLSLAARIQLFKTRKPKLAQTETFLTAVRWLGNQGSHAHSRGLSDEQLMTGFELLAALLDEFFVGSRKSLVKKAKVIIAKKGKV